MFCASDWLYGICFLGTIILFFNPIKVNLIGFLIIIMLLRLFQSNSSKLPRIMSYMGRHTMEIYLLHFFFLPNDFKYIASVISPNMGGQNLSVELMVAILVASVCIVLALLLGKILNESKYTSWILGN